MAKKVTITEMVIKLGVDSKAAARALRNYERKIDKTNKKNADAQKKERDHERKRIINAKAWLAQSREFSNLKKRSQRDALKAEQALTKAYQKNDKVQMASIKRQIGERLAEYKMRDRHEEELQRKQVKSRRAIQKMEDKSRKTKIREDKRLAQERERSLRQEQRLARIRKETRKMGMKSFVKSTQFPFGTVAAGAGLTAAVAGGAGILGGGMMLDARRAQTGLAAMLGQQGTSPQEMAAIDRRLQRINAFYNINNAEAYRTVSGLRGTVSPDVLNNQQLLDLFGNLSALRMGGGYTNEQFALAAKGLQQMIGSGTFQMQEFYQQSEAMPLLGQALAKAVGVALGKEVQVGDLKKLADQGVLSSINTQGEFLQALMKEMGAIGIPLARRMKGSAPERFDAMMKAMTDSTVLFFQGFEQAMTEAFGDVNKFLYENQDATSKLGEAFGRITAQFWRLAMELAPATEKFMDSFADWLSTVTAEDVVNAVDTVTKVLTGLFALFLAGKIAGSIMAVTEALSAMRKMAALAAGTEALSGGGKGGKAGGLLGNTKFIRGAGVAGLTALLAESFMDGDGGRSSADSLGLSFLPDWMFKPIGDLFPDVTTPPVTNFTPSPYLTGGAVPPNIFLNVGYGMEVQSNFDIVPNGE